MATKRIKLSEFAKEQGIAYITAYRHWQLGHIEGRQLPTGSILVSDWLENAETNKTSLTAIVYSRVSQSSQKNKLKQQTIDLLALAEEKGYDVIDTVEEVGTGFSDHRTKLLSILYRTDWNVLIVEDRNTFLKFSYPYVEALLRRNGQEVISLSDYVPETEKQSKENIPLTGEQELITLITRTRNIFKSLIGMNGPRNSVEQIVTGLLQ